MSSLTLEQILPQLLAAYDRGLLVPFIGAGMSRDFCPGWTKLVERLEEEAGISRLVSEPSNADLEPVRPDALIRRASRSVTLLRNRGAAHFREAIRRAIYQDVPGTSANDTRSEKIAALARLPWPLTITTNYDTLFANEFVRVWKTEWEKTVKHSKSKPPRTDLDFLQVMGRSETDLQRVLSSLAVADVPILWALQGYITRDSATDSELTKEIVVGHEEYRRVTYVNQHFRRSFAEVFRRRSFLFLGSGLAEPYFLDLFNEVLEFFGPNPQPHYALVSADDTIDAGFLRERFNINAVNYGSYNELPDRLNELADEIRRPRLHSTRWGFRVSGESSEKESSDPDALTIVRGTLPDPTPGSGTCTIVSAGLEHGAMYLSGRIAGYVASIDERFRNGNTTSKEKTAPWLFEISSHSEDKKPTVAAVSAWENEEKRDLRLIEEAMQLALDWTEKNGFEHVQMPLLAAGNSRHFHARYSLIQMVRGYARWISRQLKKSRPIGKILPRLTIHVIDSPTLLELASGRLDIIELLALEDIRFWAEVTRSDSGSHRELMIQDDEWHVSDVARALAIEGEQWEVSVIPSPSMAQTTLRLPAVKDQSLSQMGVLPGSTLRFTAV